MVRKIHTLQAKIPPGPRVVRILHWGTKRDFLSERVPFFGHTVLVISNHLNTKRQQKNP
jgi:hypothetical protein